MQRQRKIQYTIIAAVACIAVAAALFLYYSINPDSTVWIPKCMFHELTGFKCPGCGMQRALHSALHGDFATALHYNYALPAILILILLYGVTELSPLRASRLRLLLYSPITLSAIFAMVVAWWVIRNVIDM